MVNLTLTLEQAERMSDYIGFHLKNDLSTGNNSEVEDFVDLCVGYDELRKAIEENKGNIKREKRSRKKDVIYYPELIRQ